MRMIMLLIAESMVAYLVHEIGSSIVEEINFLRGVRNQVSCLAIRLRHLRAVLNDECEESSSRSKCDELLRIHRKEIRKLAREMENLIDSYASIFREENIAKRYVFQPCNLVRIHRIGVKIERIQRRIQEAVSAVNDVQSLGVSVDDHHKDDQQSSSSSDMRSRL